MLFCSRKSNCIVGFLFILFPKLTCIVIILANSFKLLTTSCLYVSFLSSRNLSLSNFKMKLVILDTSKEVSDWAASYLMKRITDFNPGPDNYFVLGLPTGEFFYYSYSIISIAFQI